MAQHKLGFHINAISKPVADAIVRIRPRLIKTLHHDANFWRKARELLPDAFIFGRLYTPNQEFEDNPIKRGREFAERILKEEVNKFEVNGKPIYNAWESYNEIMNEITDDDKQKKYDDFQVAFGETIRAEGFEPVGMNFATGNFSGQQFLANFPGTLETYKYLGFHEYDWPTLDRLHKIGLADGNGGMWLALRYRRIMQTVRQMFPDRHTAIVTELGMTRGVVGGPDVGPWNIEEPISPDDYWQSLLWYNSEIMKDDFALGACLFVVGAIHPWESFEHLGPMLDRLAAFQESTPAPIEPQPPTDSIPPTDDTPIHIDEPPTDDTHPIPPADTIPPTDTAPIAGGNIPDAPSPPPAFPGADVTPPAESGGSITIQLPAEVAAVHTHYFLFPKDTPAWWYAAAEDYFEQFGVTRGERLEEALFLRGTQGHTITLLNPSPEVLAKIQRLNPGATLDVITAASPAELADVLRGRIMQGVAFP